MNPVFPIYLPTKGRSEIMLTSRVLTGKGIPHYLVVEPQEVQQYQEAVDTRGLSATVLMLDPVFKARYELCDNFGLTKSTGPGPARNFAWEHSKAAGCPWHWVMDDNIIEFWRLERNLKVRVSDGTIFRCMEDFCLRYSNVAMAGPNYYAFASRKNKMKPYALNTRIYSCNLIRNDLPFRWRGRYNEDTILFLDMLSAGWCTVEFNAFLQMKSQTQALPGGCTGEFYLKEGKRGEGEKYADQGTVAKSRMIAAVYPDIAKMVWKFSRWHHQVDYSKFKRNRLRLRPGVVLPEGPDDFGMRLTRRERPGG